MDNVLLKLVKNDENSYYIKEFLQHMKSDKGCRPKTVISYLSDLTEIKDFFVNRNLLELKESDIRRYKFHLVERDLAPRTVNRRISVIRSFFTYFVYSDEYEQIYKNPARNIPSMKIPSKKPITMSENQSENFLTSIILIGRYGLRDYALFSTFLFTGMRISEVAALKIQDIDFDRGVIEVRDGKGGKDRTIPMMPRLSQTLSLWINNEVAYDEKVIKMKTKQKKKLVINKAKSGRKLFLDGTGSDEDFAFITKYGKPFSHKGIAYLFQRYIDIANYTKDGLSPHAMRRSFLTHLKRQGVDLFTLQKISGHARVATLEHYLEIDDKEVAAAVDMHPSSNRGLDWNMIDTLRK